MESTRVKIPDSSNPPTRRSALAGLASAFAIGCHRKRENVEPQIEFTKLPLAGEGSPEELDSIEGRVQGAQRGQRIVVFAKTSIWWVQPFANQPFTAVQRNSMWKTSTHPGTAYAALLVAPGYQPPPTARSLPAKGGPILAVAMAEGTALRRPVSKPIRFGGFDWRVRENVSSPGGTRNAYNSANARVDENGFLHLIIAKKANQWTSAEISLSESLGYGSYFFTVRDTSHLEPAAVLNLSILDNAESPREVDIEMSRWGESAGKNAQYVVQPYYVPENSVRFTTPQGLVTHAIGWGPDRVSFESCSGDRSSETGAFASHVFTSGIPSPGNDAVHMNLYVFGNQRNPLQRNCEVIIEKFEYFP